MGAFFEFCRAHPWQMMIVLFSVASFSMTLGYIIASLFANNRIRNLDNVDIAALSSLRSSTREK